MHPQQIALVSDQRVHGCMDRLVISKKQKGSRALGRAGLCVLDAQRAFSVRIVGPGYRFYRDDRETVGTSARSMTCAARNGPRSQRG